ncbi:MAG: hypothetical protein R3F56_11880 [Planctomycetota bacterium]
MVETFVLEPGLFDTCIAMSPSLWWNDHALARHADELLRGGADRHGALWLTSADEADIVADAAAFAAAVQRAAPGVQLVHEPMPAQFHDTIFAGQLARVAGNRAALETGCSRTLGEGVEGGRVRCGAGSRCRGRATVGWGSRRLRRSVRVSEVVSVSVCGAVPPGVR